MYVMPCNYGIIAKFNSTVPGSLLDDGNTRLSTNSPTFAATTLGQEPVSTTVTVKSITYTDISRSNIIFIAVGISGGISFLVMVIVAVVVRVFVSFSTIRRKKAQLYAIAKSKLSEQISSEQQHSSNSDHELDILEPPVLKTRATEGVVEFEGENETDEDRSRLTRVTAVLNPVPTCNVTATAVQNSSEQLYFCPIMSNVYEPEPGAKNPVESPKLNDGDVQ